MVEGGRVGQVAGRRVSRAESQQQKASETSMTFSLISFFHVTPRRDPRPQLKTWPTTMDSLYTHAEYSSY
jgi:hypothetical protein